MAKGHVVKWMRWIARVLGLLLLALVLSIAIGEGLSGEPLSDWRKMSLKEVLLWIALIATLLGIPVAWRWEGIGGTMTVGSALLFMAVNSIASGYFRINWVFLAFALVGLLFLACWWKTRASEQS